VLIPDHGPVLTSQVLGRPTTDLLAHLRADEVSELRAAVDAWRPGAADPEAAVFAAPYLRPRLILGIGLNYSAHAADLGEQAPRSSPASFIKGDHTIVGPGEPIIVPRGIGRVTAEAELGLVIGRRCHRVGVADALDHVVGVCAVLDQTAESILLENPRYLTRVKNYPTFFSFGPVIITLDEVFATVGDLDSLRVRTIHNGREHAADAVSHMTFSPAELLSFHSHVMPFEPGDILSTGTPGAAPIEDGDTVSCDLVGLSMLTNPVRAEPSTT
jgi:2-keto-4-pentenoate hydratase/2-oxohepta-3-ene-1,7-dioic acid hydratase in catechol pathway